MSATTLIKNSRLLSLTRFYWLITLILAAIKHPLALPYYEPHPSYSLLFALTSMGVPYSIGLVFCILVEIIPMMIMVLLDKKEMRL